MRNGLLIVSMVVLGILLGLAALCIVEQLCSSSKEGLFCKSMLGHPPWFLLSGIAATPVAILTWIWRKEAKDEDQRIKRLRLFTERYQNYATQLTNPRHEVQLGAIYGLGSLAGEDESGESKVSVGALLCTFLKSADRDPAEDIADGTPAPPDAVGPVMEPGCAAMRVLSEGKFEVNLSSVDLSATPLAKIELPDAQLRGANFSAAGLDGSDLAGADLTAAILFFANLHRANLKGAKLKRANLQGAMLEETDLSGADLTNANLKNVKLTGATIDVATNFSGVKYNESTVWPEGFLPPKSAVKKVGLY